RRPLPCGKRQLVAVEDPEGDLVGMMTGHQPQLVDQEMPRFGGHAPIVAPSALCGSTSPHLTTTLARSGTRPELVDCSSSAARRAGAPTTTRGRSARTAGAATLRGSRHGGPARSTRTPSCARTIYL